MFIGVTIAIPYMPSASAFGFIPLPAPLIFTVLGLTILYVVATEAAKKFFYARINAALGSHAWSPLEAESNGPLTCLPR